MFRPLKPDDLNTLNVTIVSVLKHVASCLLNLIHFKHYKWFHTCVSADTQSLIWISYKKNNSFWPSTHKSSNWTDVCVRTETLSHCSVTTLISVHSHLQSVGSVKPHSSLISGLHSLQDSKFSAGSESECGLKLVWHSANIYPIMSWHLASSHPTFT